jgi:phosphoribosyl 1,2-cyclic phosphodiesterase
MQIRCWGSRGQIPVSGPEFNKYGGDTTCIEVRSERGDIIIIDAGSGIRSLAIDLIKEKVQKVSLLFTHLHLDHIIGFPYFSPIYNSSFKMNVFGCPFQSSNFEEALHGMMRSPYFPVDLRSVSAKINYKDITTKPFKIGSISIQPIFLNHPNGGLGFRLEENGAVFVFLTDNELSEDIPGCQPLENFVDFAKGADLLIHDAEFDREEYNKYKGWGHSTYDDAVRLGVEAGVSRLGLFHTNNRRTDKQLDQIVRKAQNLVSKSGAKLECFAVGSGFKLEL